MQNVHPSYGFGVADLAQVDLDRLQVLMPQNDFGYDLQWYPIAACIGGRMPTQVMGKYFAKSICIHSIVILNAY